MTKLIDLVNNKHKIIAYATASGFKNIAIHDPKTFDSTSPLFLLVDLNREDPTAFSTRTASLSQQLEELLGCVCLVLIRECLDELGKDMILAQSCFLEKDNFADIVMHLFDAESLDDEEILFTPLAVRMSVPRQESSYLSALMSSGFMSVSPKTLTPNTLPSENEQQSIGSHVSSRTI